MYLDNSIVKQPELTWYVFLMFIRSLALYIVAHMLNNAVASLGIQLNAISFFIGAIIFIISGIFFQRYIRELKCVDINFEENSISSKG
ncbi:hypothetical protein [Clostridium botulinum]|uniref:hypothetical protein n=1 Tax=Clostridium botulinum TaxID=1491 RepID=UPI00131BBB7C|nr:hypothetical protein [Clostridium botulinum]